MKTSDYEEEEEICCHCNGSGEGLYDGSRCGHCKGTGVEFDNEGYEDYLAERADQRNDELKYGW